MQNEEHIISQYLREINHEPNWKELTIHVEIQPGMLGFKGLAILEDSTTKSLRSRPTEELKSYIKDLHTYVAINSESKWNKLEFTLYPDSTFKRNFIWDSKWQNEVDSENIKFKEKNPNYKLPKWKWDDASSKPIA